MRATLPRLRRYRKSLHPPDAFRAADLLVEHEDLLIEELRCLDEASLRQRLGIRAQLAKIRGELEATRIPGREFVLGSTGIEKRGLRMTHFLHTLSAFALCCAVSL